MFLYSEFIFLLNEAANVVSPPLPLFRIELDCVVDMSNFDFETIIQGAILH